MTNEKRYVQFKLLDGKQNEFLVAYQANDGWYDVEGRDIAVSPDKDVAIQDPWYADYITPAPKWAIELISQGTVREK